MDITENVAPSGMRLWYARPDTSEPRPLMVMCHERYGPVEQSWNVVRTMAGYGYVACLADLFHRYEGDRGPLERSEARYDPTDEQTVIDIDEAIAFMRGLDFVDGTRVGVVGFCWSGRTPMVYAGAGRDVSAIAFFHGGIYPREYVPIYEGIEPLDDVLPRVNAPICAGFAEHDQLVPMENIVRFRRDLEAQGKRARVRVFGGVGHGWFNVTRPKDYSETASREGWDMVAAFMADAFAGTLGDGPNVEFTADAGIPFDFSV